MNSHARIPAASPDWESRGTEELEFGERLGIDFLKRKESQTGSNLAKFKNTKPLHASAVSRQEISGGNGDGSRDVVDLCSLPRKQTFFGQQVSCAKHYP